MWLDTAASQSGFRASDSTSRRSKRDSSGPDSAVHSASGARGSRRAFGFVTPSTVVRVDSVVTCAAAAQPHGHQRYHSLHKYTAANNHQEARLWLDSPAVQLVEKPVERLRWERSHAHTRPALATLMVCCSIASCIVARWASGMLSNSSMQLRAIGTRVVCYGRIEGTFASGAQATKLSQKASLIKQCSAVPQAATHPQPA